MGFARIGFLNFRNLADREIGVGARQVLLVGENGQGKTNLLEAVYLLSVASSFREDRDAALLRDPALPAGLHGSYERDGEPACGLSVRWEPGRRREVRVNGKPVSDRRELLAEVLCICFVQQDSDFVTGPPEARRRFFDQVLALSHPAWLEAFRDYRRVLRARNAALKAGAAGPARRPRRADRAARPRPAGAPRVAGGRFQRGVHAARRGDHGRRRSPCSIRYRPSWAGLETAGGGDGTPRRRPARGTSPSGPRRRVRTATGSPASSTAGTSRTSPPRARCASARWPSGWPRPGSSPERTGRRPVLLLDDVLLELDPGRKQAFVDRFPDYEQAFFTFLPGESQPLGPVGRRAAPDRRERGVRDVRKVGDVLRDFLKERGWPAEDPYAPLFRGWEEIAGPELGSRSRVVEVEDGVIVVEVDHPGWLQMLPVEEAVPARGGPKGRSRRENRGPAGPDERFGGPATPRPGALRPVDRTTR